MSLRIEVTEENGLVLARVPCEIAWLVIDRLNQRAVHATFSIRGKQLLVYFRPKDRAAAQDLLDFGLEVSPPAETAADSHERTWTHRLLIGHHL